MFYENFSPLEEFGGGDWGPPFPPPFLRAERHPRGEARGRLAPPARSRRRGRRRRDGRGHAGRGGHAGDPRELLLGHRLAGQVEHRLEGAEALVLLSTVWGRARFGGVFQVHSKS